MWYVNIEGVTDEFLQILGYFVVMENDEFKIYRDYFGQEQIVRKAKPFLYVNDLNDRESIVTRSTAKQVIASPPKPKPEA